MQRLLVWTAAIVCPALALALIAGCGGATTKEDDNKPTETKSGSKVLTALDGEYTGTISGKVTFEGAKPDFAAKTKTLHEQMKAKDDTHCLMSGATEEETTWPDWKIDDKNGVANVFVWITPPKGKYFKVDLSTKPEDVELKQPHCAFVPHCLVLFPKYYKDGKLVETGQNFKVGSSEFMAHNTNVKGGFNEQILEKAPPRVVKLEPDDKPIQIDCNVHTWMHAYVGAFNHPFATVTKPDGTYEIKNVPVDVDVQIIAWHEKPGYVNKGKGKGDSITLKAKTTMDFTVEDK